jgi:DNA-binding XRE family transcriptional regulator
MSAAVKTRNTSMRRSYPLRYTLHLRRTTPRRILSEITNKYRNYIVEDMNASDDDELISVVDSDWYKEMSERMTPGKYLKTLREACGLTQTKLGKKVGASAARVCDYEAGRRQISKGVARKLSSLFLVPADKFI